MSADLTSPNPLAMPLPAAPSPSTRRPSAGDIGLWAFIAVATTLFTLFLTAYAMRMRAADWSSIAMPWQLWLSSVCLVAGSVLMHRASHAAAKGQAQQLHRLLVAGGACAMAFVAVQLWAWSSLQSARVVLASNPAASFFYVLTALHGLHVLGGLVAWSSTMHADHGSGDGKPVPASPAPAAQATVSASTAVRVRLCARYWHFLLAIWLLLFASMSQLTPEIVRALCGTA